MSTVADTISAMQSQTAAYQQSSKDRTTGMTNDSNMFLTLMLLAGIYTGACCV